MNDGDRTCTICNGPFNLDTEGGTEGTMGMLPVAFCPTCNAGIFDYVESRCLACAELDAVELDGE